MRTSRESTLLRRFNERDNKAFEEVYSSFYGELYYYAIGLYRDTEVEPCDIINDAFLGILSRPELQFKEISGIKAYLYATIRNGYKTFISHSQYVDKYKEHVKNNTLEYDLDVVESELLYKVHNVLKILPEDSAKILALTLEGLTVDEIAEKLYKTKRTIYNKKSETIAKVKQILGIKSSVKSNKKMVE